MEQKAKVRALGADGTARVLVIRESACSGDCHKCSGCGAVREKLLIDAVNAAGAQPGDTVIIRSDSAPVLTGAAVLYILPLALFFLGYFLGENAHFGPLAGFAGFVAGLVLAAVYDRKVAARRKTVYTITGITAHGPHRPE
ncbi:MAG: polyunsaturated fatty acid synthase PfaA [Ruminococcaceae bacterium]|nr:polyunsaturated fatty acid synthase PfaA [Oscillospiraceae bacterium]